MLMLYTCSARKTQKKKEKKKELFFEIERNSQELPLLVKMCLFSRKESLFILLGAFRGHFSNSSVPPKHVKKKSCLRIKLGAELQEILV